SVWTQDRRQDPLRDGKGNVLHRGPATLVAGGEGARYHRIRVAACAAVACCVQGIMPPRARARSANDTLSQYGGQASIRMPLGLGSSAVAAVAVQLHGVRIKREARVPCLLPDLFVHAGAGELRDGATLAANKMVVMI